MTWFKVDDKLHGHKKAARAGAAAMGLWVLAGSWCADQLTDGFVPDFIASRLDRDAEVLAKNLVDAGLWVEGAHDGDNGWWFNDWPEYQPTREDVESRREYERDKKRRQRRNPQGQYEVSPGESRGDTPGESDGGSLRESTRPVPSRPEPTTNPSSTVVDTDDTLRGFDEFWTVWPKRGGRKVGKDKAQDRWRKLTLDDRRAAYRGAVNYAKASEEGHQGAMDAWRWLRDKLWVDFIDAAEADTRRSPRDRPVTLLNGEEFGI